MDRKKLRRIAGASATMATVLILSLMVLVAAFALTDREFGRGLPAWKAEANEIVLDTTIGATVESLDAATAEMMGLPTHDKGLVITSLAGDGPAARAGIRAGDVIERVGGIPVASPGDAAAALKDAHGAEIILMLNRRGHYVIAHLPIRTAPEMRELAKQGGER